MPKIDTFLKVMRDAEASDLHLSSTGAPILRVHGRLEEARHRALTEDEVRFLIYELLSDTQIERLEAEGSWTAPTRCRGWPAFGFTSTERTRAWPPLSGSFLTRSPRWSPLGSQKR